jgi:hypothetical protein
MKLQELKEKVDALYKEHGGDIEVYRLDYKLFEVEGIVYGPLEDYSPQSPFGILIE